MDTVETTEETPTSLGKTAAVELVHSAAITAGVVIGFAVVGVAVSKVRDIRAARKTKTDPNKIED